MGGTRWTRKTLPLLAKPLKRRGLAARHAGFVGGGKSHETAAFAVAGIRNWWQRVGRVQYAGQDQLLVEADCGGPNRKGSWLWHAALQPLADEFGLTITIRHLPPSAS